MRISLFVLLVCICFSAVGAQDNKIIQLKNEHVAYAPKSFYISDVVDDRGVTSIGVIAGNGRKDNLSLAGGTAAQALKSFIGANVSQNKSTQAMTLHITKLDVSESVSGSTRHVTIAIALSFYAGDKKLLDVSGKGEGEMSDDASGYIESYIRETLAHQLKEFDDWWGENKGHYALQQAVKVNVTIVRTTDKPNLIGYSLQRPLAIADFTGPVDANVPELAATYSGIAMGYMAQVQNGQMVLNVTITPNFDKTNSWFKEAGKNPTVLAHEQAHFDITAIKACELAQAIRAASFTQDNYEQLLEQLRQQKSKESDQEEKTYDDETNHGIIADKQAEWQARVKQQVRQLGCYSN